MTFQHPKVVVERAPGPDLPTPRRMSAGARLADGRAIVAGGNVRGPDERPTSGSCEVDHRSLDEVLVFDPARLTWTAAPRLNRPREGAMVHAYEEGRVVVVGGLVDFG
jgi:hypothetical protein